MLDSGSACVRAESLYCRGLKEAVRAASRVEAGTLSPMPVVQCVGEITSGGEQTKQREGDAPVWIQGWEFALLD